MRRLSRILLLASVCAVSLSACGGESPRSEPSATPSLPALADGTIPWLDLPASARDFDFPSPAPRPVDPKAKPCRASALQGSLEEWIPQQEPGNDAPHADPKYGLYGWVKVTNRSGRTCTLQGEVPTTISSRGQTVRIRYSHHVGKEFLKLATVHPGEAVLLRLGWSIPFCGDARTDQVLHITIPDGGGELEAPVLNPMQPGCSTSELHPELRSYLSSGSFEEILPGNALDSALNPIEISVDGPSTATPGTRLRYFVTLTNPTMRAIVLSPCPGYQESVGYETSLRFLNCLTVGSLAARGSLRFEMFARIPATAASGERVAIWWNLIATTLNPAAGRHQARLIVTAT